jgi:vitamin B12 transporter
LSAARPSALKALAAVVIGLAALTPVVAAEEVSEQTTTSPIIVTASRLETDQRSVASSVTTVTADDIAAGQYRTVIDALAAVPGVEVVQSGGPGGNAVAFIRGANSEHTLVLLDGIELNNPASPNRAFNVANLTLENIERIEVVRGPQSSLYGSDAIGGVINIISKVPQAGARMNITSEAGGYGSFTQLGAASYADKQVEFSSGVTRQDIGSISAANSRDGNLEHDPYENTSLSGRAKWRPTELFDTAVTTRYDRSRANLDNSGGVGGDDPNRRIRNEELFLRGESTAHLLKGVFTPRVSLAYSRHQLGDRNDPDQRSSELLRSEYNGDLLKLQGTAEIRPIDEFSMVVGAETERERADSFYRSDGAFGPYEDTFLGRDVRTNALFGESRVELLKQVYIDLGGRVDNHAIFGRYETFRVAPAVLLPSGTKLRGSVGTGFKAPSLVQLYSSFGDPQLRPEESTGWDIGVDQKLLRERVTFGVAYYKNSFDNLITFNPSTFVLSNIANASTHGVEFSGDIRLTSMVQLKATYTYTDSEDQATGAALLRRPKNVGTVTLLCTPTERLRAQLQWRGYGSRFDNDFSTGTPSRVSLGGYGLLYLTGSYQLTEKVELFARIDNLLDKEYEEVYGFGTLGAAAYGGVKVTL